MAQFQAKIMSMVYGQPQPMVSMWANQEDGIYSEYFAPMSYKISLAYVALVPAAISGAVVAPMAAQQRNRAREMQRRAEEAAREAEAAADAFR